MQYFLKHEADQKNCTNIKLLPERDNCYKINLWFNFFFFFVTYPYLNQ